MSKSALAEQMDWYSTQPPSYRRMWWEWASTQPNFRAMLEWARHHEKDETVRMVIDIWRERC